MVQGALASGKATDRIREQLTARREACEARMRQRFRRATADGDLPADIDAADLARLVATVLHGMAVEAAGGASRRELRRVAEMVLRAWPG